MSVRLSKSKLIAFRQCSKRLWLEIHRPELKVWDEATQRRFATGSQVGDLARREHPAGYLIAPDDDLARAKADTQAEIASGRPRVLFEATFEAKGILVRADLLIPRNDGWHMVEVKSSTQPKDNHLEDAAIQSWVVCEAGLPLAATSLQLIDSSWIYPGGGNYAGIFKTETVDHRVQPLLAEVPRWLEAAMGVAEGSEPSVKMGGHCNDPFACAFQEYCGSSLKPMEMPISWIPNLRSSKRAQLEAQGIVDIRQVDLELLTDGQRTVAEAYLKGEVVRLPLPEEVTERLTGTRYYVDFETVMFAVPIWQGTRPYEQIPFQWSCHIEEPGQPMRHLEFLDLSGEDSSRRFAESLIAAVGKVGPVIVYSRAFEATRLRELAVRFPDDLAMPLKAIAARIVDLRPITRRHFFHPGLMGSWSIKSVLKTIRPDLSYDLLGEVAEGGAAPEAYLEAIEEGTTRARKEEIRKALLAYCERDTEAMVHVLGYLSEKGI